jgi:hypothetical protein
VSAGAAVAQEPAAKADSAFKAEPAVKNELAVKEESASGRVFIQGRACREGGALSAPMSRNQMHSFMGYWIGTLAAFVRMLLGSSIRCMCARATGLEHSLHQYTCHWTGALDVSLLWFPGHVFKLLGDTGPASRDTGPP